MCSTERVDEGGLSTDHPDTAHVAGTESTPADYAEVAQESSQSQQALAVQESSLAPQLVAAAQESSVDHPASVDEHMTSDTGQQVYPSHHTDPTSNYQVNNAAQNYEDSSQMGYSYQSTHTAPQASWQG